ncbi:MAG: thiolase family protein [Spirochaetales bacterium]|nr:thiolase family protein [Spirochaetales bacterium]
MGCKEIVLVDSLRTPIGKVDGALSSLLAPELGAPIIEEMIRRYPIIRDNTENIIIGNSVSAGVGQNPARQTALLGGMCPGSNAFTVNQVCGSGMSVVGLSRAMMIDQDTRLAIAGAVESCSNTPLLLDRKNIKEGREMILVDSLHQDGLNCAIEDVPMGDMAEEYALLHSISREEQDDFAYESHDKALSARKSGIFDDEIIGIDIKGGNRCVSDENIRVKCMRERLSRLQPVYRKEGSITAGNSSGLGDCASLVLLAEVGFAKSNNLKPLVRILDSCVMGTPLKSVFSGGAQVFEKLLKRNGLTVKEIDIFEICESFACTALGFLKETGVSREKINPYGGDIALGHPMGASGSRLLTTLTHAMVREDKKRGIAIMSMGGGHSMGILLEKY